jgi:hypothetical protein
MNDSDTTVLQVDMGIVKSQMVDMKRQNDRIEKKLDAMTYITKEDAKDMYAAKGDFVFMSKLVWFTLFALLGIAVYVIQERFIA